MPIPGLMAATGYRSRPADTRLGTDPAFCRPVTVCGSRRDLPTYGGQSPQFEKVSMGSLIKKRRKKMSKHKYRKRLRADRHKRK